MELHHRTELPVELTKLELIIRCPLTWPDARVIACECDPENFQLLQKNLRGYSRVEPVQKVVLGEDASEADFFLLPDKFTQNGGAGSCVRKEPGSVKARLPAMSVAALWRSRKIVTCDYLKMDCEGSEIPILAALAQARLLESVRLIAGEWHALEPDPESGRKVREELRKHLESTHTVTFSQREGGQLGLFFAQPRQL